MNKKSLSINLLILFATLLICFIFTEIFIRVLWQERPLSPAYGYPPGLFVLDDTKGYSYKPGFKGVFSGRSFEKIEIWINSKGLRDIEHDYIKKGKFRILGLGDSVTFGSGVKVEDTYLSVLERLIKINSDEKSDIIKAGINGYEFDQEYTYYMEEGYKYNPDIVLIAVVLNDSRMIDPAVVKKWLTEDDDKDEIEQGKAEKIINIFLSHCYTYKFIHYTLFNIRRDKYHLEYFEHFYQQWQDEPWNNYSKKLINLKNKAKSKKSKVVLVLFPYIYQFQYSKDYGRLPQKKITALALKNGIEVIDLYTALNRKDYMNFYLKKDTLHLNEKGNKLVGEFIYSEMTKKGLIKL